VRSANTGISALIEPTGAIRARSPLFEEWIHADVILLKKDGPSVYARVGDIFAYICAFFSVAAVLLFRSRRSSRMW
ncbi:MAG: apolipoprotein N-acyltransferase, partial [Nitrospinae bacterium]|nr:apolipoprotein N-acyltransferase [Nitrospinota bacterium]